QSFFSPDPSPPTSHPLSLHDALPIFEQHPVKDPRVVVGPRVGEDAAVIDIGDRYLIATSDPITFASDDVAWYALQVNANDVAVRSEEHTSELQSRFDLVCRLLLEKKK